MVRVLKTEEQTEHALESAKLVAELMRHRCSWKLKAQKKEVRGLKFLLFCFVF